MPYRDDHLICIELGSYETRSIFGLAESLTPPQARSRTRVGKRQGSEGYVCGDELAKAEEAHETLEIIKPISAGCVVDWDALTAFLAHLIFILTSEEPGSKLSEFPVILVVSPQWSMVDKEQATRIFFEKFLRPAFMIIDTPLASLYACNITTGLVVDVGYEKTDITGIVDSITLPTPTLTLPIGGHHLTEGFLALLRTNPPLDQSNQEPMAGAEIVYQLAEKIKCSQICEVLVDGRKAAENTKDDIKPEEGVLDIAAVLASGKTREYLARAQAEKNGQKVEAQEFIPNAQLSHNTIDVDSRTIVVGNDRFLACNGLLDGQLAGAIYDAITRGVNPASRRQELWENIVLVGGGSKVKGFREKLIQSLQQRFGSVLAQASADPYSPALYPPYPTSIRASRIPVHFPEWNSKEASDSMKGFAEEATFLGGCIIAHIAFASSETGSARLYVTRSDYSESGPASIR